MLLFGDPVQCSPVTSLDIHPDVRGTSRPKTFGFSSLIGCAKGIFAKWIWGGAGFSLLRWEKGSETPSCGASDLGNEGVSNPFFHRKRESQTLFPHRKRENPAPLQIHLAKIPLAHLMIPFLKSANVRWIPTWEPNSQGHRLKAILRWIPCVRVRFVEGWPRVGAQKGGFENAFSTWKIPETPLKITWFLKSRFFAHFSGIFHGTTSMKNARKYLKNAWNILDLKIRCFQRAFKSPLLCPHPLPFSEFGGVPSTVEQVVHVRFCCLLPWKAKLGVTSRTVLGDEDSNFSVFRARRFSEWPEPLHWIVFPVEILTKPLIHWIASPLFTETPFFHWKVLGRIPFPKIGSEYYLAPIPPVFPMSDRKPEVALCLVSGVQNKTDEYRGIRNKYGTNSHRIKICICICVTT